MKELKKKALHLEPMLRIGKNGLTKGMIEEITSQLKKKKLIKIKFLKAYIEGKDRKEEAKRLSMLTKSQLVDITGNVLVLYKEK